MAKTQNKTAKVDTLNVVPGCSLQVITESNGKMIWRTVATCAYTPRAIAQTAKANKMAGPTVWVSWACGRELWNVTGELAAK